MEIKSIGIIGGGQLGKMMILEGKKLGFSFTILDPSSDCPASSVADHHIVENFYDREALVKLADMTDVMTYEFEHIDADLLIELEAQGHKIYPSPKTLKIIQNKLWQKVFLSQNNIPVGKFKKVRDTEDLREALDEYRIPLVLKTCKNGYDGKGNVFIEKQDEIEESFKSLDGKEQDLMVEEYIPFKKEISVIVARGLDGEIKTYPIGENIHKDSILRTTIVPARVSIDVEKKAEKVALDIVELMRGVGIFCIEMFVDGEDNILVNEIAPRPHNSGHYTIESCATSQFSQHVRIVSGLPLGDTNLVSPAVMINLLGREGQEGRYKLMGLDKALQIPRVYVHFYGKTVTKPKRKLGHITVLGEDTEEAISKAEKVKGLLKILSLK